MKKLPRFWKALDDVPGLVTDTRDWRVRLGDEFGVVAKYLRRTGEIAILIDCPSPGGDGCPRNVVSGGHGRFRAVCGTSPNGCDSVDLSPEDVAIRAIDRSALINDLVRAFDVTPALLSPGKGRVSEFGQYAVAAGVSSLVILALPGPREPITAEELHLAGLGADHAIILVPRVGSLPPRLRARITQAGHLLLDLSEITGPGADGRIELLQSTSLLLEPIRLGLLARLKVASSGPVFAVAAGTLWGQIVFSLTSEETLICSTPSFSRQTDPGEFGMRNAKNNRPTIAWTLFVQAIAEKGLLKSRAPKLDTQIRKQKQVLADRLCNAFGIAADPLPWDKSLRAYVAQFVVRDQRPKATKQAQSVR